jgi:hypothetical protein
MAGHHLWLIYYRLTGFLDPNREISQRHILAKNTSARRFSKETADRPAVVRVLRLSHLPEDRIELSGARKISSRRNACPAGIAA